jgi:Tfp pilus assembly protein PilN
MSEGINLLDPDKKSKRSGAVLRFEGLRIFAGSMLFLVSTASVILFILVAISPLPKLQEQQRSLEQTLSTSKTDIAKLAYVNERTDTINQILTKRQSLDQTLGLIESKLPGDVHIAAIRADKNVVTVTATGKSLQSLDTFLNGLLSFVKAKSAFSQATMTELASDDQDGVYSMTINIVLTGGTVQ